MITVHKSSYGVSPEQLEQIMQAARTERAKAVRNFFRRLFHRQREAQLPPVPNQAFMVNC